MTAILPERCENDEVAGISYSVSPAWEYDAGLGEWVPSGGARYFVTTDEERDEAARRAALVEAEAQRVGALVRESVTVDAAGDFIGMTRPEWEAAAVCPEWCRAFHDDDNEVDKRTHHGELGEVPLSLDGVTLGFEPAEPGVIAQMVTNEHRAAPYVQLDVSESANDGFAELTLDEAAQLAEWLLAQVRLGREAAAR